MAFFTPSLFNILLICLMLYIIPYKASVVWINPCSFPSNADKSFCDQTKTFEERSYDLVYKEIPSLHNGMAAYANLTGNTAKPVPDLNIGAYQWWNEALHGIMCAQGTNCDGPINTTTMFPEPITTASSFNSSLFYQIGVALGMEGRAMYNNNQSGLTYWAPNINIFRDPRWGRGQETPGEDPFLNSIYATHFIRGMQGYYDNVKYLKSSSCCKHFADYSLEDSDGETRKTFDAMVSEYDQNDTYLVAFKYCVIDGNASGIMCSLNAENGIPSCANKELMTNYLRKEMGFNGYITSDCAAVEAVQNNHHYTNSTGATINAVFSAGMDINCGSYTQTYTENAVKSGDAQLTDIQRAVYDSILVQMRLGYFDETNITTNPYDKYGVNDVCSNSTLKLSLDATLQSIVLLKNDNNLLPINVTNYKTVALIGPNANNAMVMEGNYHSKPPFCYTMYNGLETYYNDNNNILYEQGCSMDNSSTNGFESAINISKMADITILVMGLDDTQENEKNDRTSIAMPGVQNELIGNITQNSVGPIILIILSGGCVDISIWRDNNKIHSIIWGGYPGMYGGLAIANILYGDYNPSGKLTQTWYYTNYTQQILMTDMNMRPNKTTNSIGRGYRYYPGDVVYKFGDGLSFTKFICSKAIINNDNNKISTIIQNIGNMDGSPVVLIYFIPNNAGNNGIPIKRLIAFRRVNQLKISNSYNLTMDIYKEFVESTEQKNGGQYVASGSCQ